MLLRHQLLHFMLHCVLLLTLVGCDGADKKKHAGSREIQPAACVVCIRHYPGHSIAGEGTESGLVLAIWQDRRVLRTADASKLGQSYIAGYLSPPDWARLERLLADYTARTADEDQLALDAPSRRMIVSFGRGRSEYAESLPRAQESLMSKVERLVFHAELLNATNTAAPANETCE